jgi:hypothetical protein
MGHAKSVSLVAGRAGRRHIALSDDPAEHLAIAALRVFESVQLFLLGNCADGNHARICVTHWRFSSFPDAFRLESGKIVSVML